MAKRRVAKVLREAGLTIRPRGVRPATTSGADSRNTDG